MGEEIVDIAEMMLLIKLQQASSAWNIGNINEENRDGSIDPLLFAGILQAALQANGTAESALKANSAAESAMPVGSGADNQAKTNTAGKNIPNSGGNPNLEEIIGAMGQKYGVDSNLIKEVVKAESGFNSHAVSRAGAKGLMQLMPSTASSYGVRDSFDSIQNLDGGTHFLKDLLDRYQGNIPLALAAYNAGPGAVDKYDGIPPYSETQAYVKKIMTGLNGIDHKV
jgi:soluble lytic murein transglycosylase-like protein